MSDEGRTRLDPDEDARLVERCRSGDARAWEVLVRRHERLVYAVTRSYRLAEADTADVFQEVFAALCRGLPRIRDARALVRWLSSTSDRIARATALRRRREQAMGLADDPAALDSRPGTDPAVDADLEELEARALLRVALEGLPLACRRLLTALYYEDPPPSYAALSKRLGVPIGSLGPTRARCLERLRLRLARLESGEESVRPATESSRTSGTGISEGISPTSTLGRTVPPGSREESDSSRKEDRR